MSVLEISEKDFLTGARKGIQSEKFYNWLNTKNQAMGGEKPVSYLDTFSGIQLVMDELNAIEYGFSA